MHAISGHAARRRVVMAALVVAIHVFLDAGV
jgi:hypothetical protein